MTGAKVRDLERLRSDFPILSGTRVRNKPLVYLDNAATTHKPRAVIDAVSNFYAKENSNTHRGAYFLSEQATAMYDRTRHKIKEFINASFDEEIVFTRGTTDSINLVAYGWGMRNLRKGDEIIISEMEHHSNIVPWHIISRYTGAKIKCLPIEEDGTISTERLARLISNRTKLLAITHISNVLGAVNDIRAICELAHKEGVVVMADGAQSAGHIKVDVQLLGCDFYAASGHKMYAPTGIGFLYIKKDLFGHMGPFMGGGNMIKLVEMDNSTYKDIPDMFEAGTMPIASIAGLGAAIDYLSGIGMDAIHEREHELASYAIESLGAIPDVLVHGPTDLSKKAALFSFSHKSIHPHDIATVLDYEGIAIRAGHHCAQPLMKRLGVPATSRISLSFYNTRGEIDAFTAALKKAILFFSRRS